MATKPKPKPEPEPEPEPEEDTAASIREQVTYLMGFVRGADKRMEALEERMAKLEAEMKEPPIRLGRRA